MGTVNECGTPGCNAITAEGNRLLEHAQEAGVIWQEITFADLLYAVNAISIAFDNESPSKVRVAHLVDLVLDGVGVH